MNRESNKQTTLAGDIKVYCSHSAIVAVSDIKPNPKNPNNHPENQIELLANIIKKQGWRQPIKVSTLSGFIVSGHGRYQAALFMGAKYVPVDYQDYENEEEELADLLADNRIAELAEIDDKALAGLFSELDIDNFEVELTGYSAEEYKKLTEALVDSIKDTETKERVDLSEDVGDVFEVIVECGDEEEQRQIYEKLVKEGYECRVLTL